MASVSSSVSIAKPVEEVFEYVTNPANYSAWAEQVVGATVSPEGPVRLGSIYTLSTKVMGRTMDTQMEVTDFAENSRWSITTIGVPASVTSVFDFEPEGDGTKLTLSMTLGSGYPKVAAGAVEKQMQQQFDANAQKIKNLLEK